VEGVLGGWLSELGRGIERFRTGGGRKEEGGRRREEGGSLEIYILTPSLGK
jgi:hypothetical protein